MNSVLLSVLVCLGTGVVTAGLVRLWIGISIRAKILDVPTHRSSHVKVTPRGGGVGIVSGLIGAVLLMASAEVVDPVASFWFGGLVAIIAALSFVDDVRSLPSLFRLGCHVGVSVWAVELFGPFPALDFPLPGAHPMAAPLMYAVTVTWLVGVTNVYNFMDGIDGIAGGQGLVAALAWSVAGWALGTPTVQWIGVALAGACGGFLVFNWSPARVFMGDVGSAPLGFCFGLLPLLAMNEAEAGGHTPEIRGTIPVFAALVVWPFLADGMVTFARRLKNGENVFTAHRSHHYQRLTIAGWSHANVARLYIGWALASCLLSAAYVRGGMGVRAVVALAAMSTVVVMAIFVGRQEKANATSSPGDSLDSASQTGS